MTLRGFYPISDFTTALRVCRCALGLFYKIFTPLAAAWPCVPRAKFLAALGRVFSSVLLGKKRQLYGYQISAALISPRRL